MKKLVVPSPNAPVTSESTVCIPAKGVVNVSAGTEKYLIK